MRADKPNAARSANIATRRSDETTVGPVINAQPRPRVALVAVHSEVVEFVRDIVADVAPTVTTVNALTRVDLDEYDCVVTMYPFTGLEQENRSAYVDAEEPWYQWSQHLPPHLSVLFMPHATTDGFVDFVPHSGEGEEPPPVALMLETHVPGRHIRYADGLPNPLQEFVRRHVAPAATEMTEHTIIAERRTATANASDPGFALRGLLYGPGDGMLAASYHRNDTSSVWIIPAKVVGDLKACLTAAFREWHELYPARFPALPDWRSERAWASEQEIRVLDRIAEAENSFDKVRRRHEAEIAEAHHELSDARDAADGYERALLSATGDELEHAVAQALTEIGFAVRLMDAYWPSDARREDLRIEDQSDPAWQAIVEVKGFTKGVGEVGLIGLQRHLALFAADEGKLPDRAWYVANHWLREDPAARPRALAGRDQVVEVFASADGLVIDTRALFVLLRLCQTRPELRAKARMALRERRGLLGWDDAAALADALLAAADGDTDRPTLLG